MQGQLCYCCCLTKQRSQAEPVALELMTAACHPLWDRHGIMRVQGPSKVGINLAFWEARTQVLRINLRAS